MFVIVSLQCGKNADLRIACPSRWPRRADRPCSCPPLGCRWGRCWAGTWRARGSEGAPGRTRTFSGRTSGAWSRWRLSGPGQGIWYENERKYEASCYFLVCTSQNLPWGNIVIVKFCKERLILETALNLNVIFQQGDFLDFFLCTIFKLLHLTATPQIPLCRRMLGSNLGLLQLRHLTNLITLRTVFYNSVSTPISVAFMLNDRFLCCE